MSSTFASLSAGLAQGFPNPVKQQLMEQTIAVLLRYVNQATPERSGALKRGNQSEVIMSGNYGRVYNQVPHAIYVHQGTKAHVIRPKGGGVLAFMVGGKMVFTKRVNHPGTKANPFYERALQQSEAARSGILQQAGDAVATRVVTR